MSPGHDDPRQVYADRLTARQARARRLAQQDLWISRARGVVFAGIALVWWLVAGLGWLAAPWVAVPVVAFLGLLVVHSRVIERRGAADLAVSFYKRGLARLDESSAGAVASGARFLDEAHPYAADLDLFGPGSLFERINGARTRMGEETLAGWLLAPADAEEVRRRQEAVAELRRRVDLREDLFVLGGESGFDVDRPALLRWGQAPPVGLPRGSAAVAASLGLLNAATLTLTLAWQAPTDALLAALLASASCALWLRGRVRQVVHAVDRPARELGRLAGVLQRLEAERFDAPWLVQRRQRLEVHGKTPARQVAHLARLLDLLESRRNQLFMPLAALLMWTTQLARAIESWRLACGPRLVEWLAALGEVEALCSLAGYAFERPDDPFPQLAETAPCYEAEGIAHPLLAGTRAVRNDLRLDEGLRLLLVSGSNMSGKSTLLRTVGTNQVLAWAGAPVRARRLRSAAFSVGASLRVHDSLQTGESRFYAEITRLRQIMDLARDRAPVLFLLDEILHGTNSADRRVGAEAVIRGLVERGAVGLVTTHDLALTEVAERMTPRAANVHFEDHLDAGRVAFDYRLRPGVVTRSNALELMRAVGLDV